MVVNERDSVINGLQHFEGFRQIDFLRRTANWKYYCTVQILDVGSFSPAFDLQLARRSTLPAFSSEGRQASCFPVPRPPESCHGMRLELPFSPSSLNELAAGSSLLLVQYNPLQPAITAASSSPLSTDGVLGGNNPACEYTAAKVSPKLSRLHAQTSVQPESSRPRVTSSWSIPTCNSPGGIRKHELELFAVVFQKKEESPALDGY